MFLLTLYISTGVTENTDRCYQPALYGFDFLATSSSSHSRSLLSNTEKIKPADVFKCESKSVIPDGPTGQGLYEE